MILYQYLQYHYKDNEDSTKHCQDTIAIINMIVLFIEYLQEDNITPETFSSCQ